MDIINKLPLPEKGDALQHVACSRHAGELFPAPHVLDLAQKSGDLLVFGIEVMHQGRSMCRAGAYDNRSTVWTPRADDRCRITLVPEDIGEEVRFSWLT